MLIFEHKSWLWMVINNWDKHHMLKTATILIAQLTDTVKSQMSKKYHNHYIKSKCDIFCYSQGIVIPWLISEVTVTVLLWRITVDVKMNDQLVLMGLCFGDSNVKFWQLYCSITRMLLGYFLQTIIVTS